MQRMFDNQGSKEDAFNRCCRIVEQVSERPMFQDVFRDITTKRFKNGSWVVKMEWPHRLIKLKFDAKVGYCYVQYLTRISCENPPKHMTTWAYSTLILLMYKQLGMPDHFLESTREKIHEEILDYVSYKAVSEYKRLSMRRK